MCTMKPRSFYCRQQLCYTLKFTLTLKIETHSESYLENIGSPILYAWIMVITEFLQELEQDPAAESSFDVSSEF